MISNISLLLLGEKVKYVQGLRHLNKMAPHIKYVMKYSWRD